MNDDWAQADDRGGPETTGEQIRWIALYIEYPHVGLIRLDEYDQVLVELRDSMK